MARSRPSDSSDSDADGSDGAVETLVAGRERRSQAGEGLKALIQDEEGDEIDLLFRQTMDEEDADDDFLDHDEAGSGDDMDESSSSSEDEQDETSPAADENSGEKVLERAEKAERLKRRRQLREPWRRPPSARTQATAASTDAGKTPVPGSSRSSDRTGPLSRPSHIVHGPVRSSLRKLTVQNRHETNKRVEESKERRKQQEQAMEAAVHRRQSAKPKALSQADRLAEAARVEQLNSKSLNRWERAESRRIEEQKAKSVALRSRRPDGPVVTWLSRPSLWTQESLVASGAGDVQKYFQTHPNLCVSSDLSKLSPVQHDPTNVDQGGAASSSREVARSTLTFGKRTSPSNEPRNEKMLPRYVSTDGTPVALLRCGSHPILSTWLLTASY